MIKSILRLLCVVLFTGMVCSCSEEANDTMSKDELLKEIEKLKSTLESNSKITKVEFEGNQMKLTFGDGTVLKTATPANIIPTVGANGNWWINGEDLGVKAEAQIPTVGPNGNWWIGDKDTGKPSAGDKGEQGDPGVGIKSISYDQTTGILRITLSDNTFKEFILSASQGDLNGNLLGDLNGEYLLKTIYNGDFPFAQFTYDDKNNVSGITYYTNVLNTPVKTASVQIERNSAGNFTRQTIAYYATKNGVIGGEGNFPDRMYVDQSGVFMTVDELFAELFPRGVPGFTPGGNYTKADLLNKLRQYDEYVQGTFSYRVTFDGDYYRVRKRIIESVQDAEKPFLLAKEDGKVYFYVQNLWEYDGELHFNRPTASTTDAYDANKISATTTDYLEVKFPSEEQFYIRDNSSSKYLAVPYGDKEDVQNGHEILNYYTPDVADVYNKDGIYGKYKILQGRYQYYNQGDVIYTTTINYSYDGEDFTIGTNDKNVCQVVVKGNKIEKIVILENGQKKDFLKFEYKGSLLDVVHAPCIQQQNIGKVVYDGQNNPVELQADVSKLIGHGYEEVLCGLGLAYRYEYFNKELGCYVTGYKYAEGMASVLKVNYNYGLKNFMNHTFTALSPLLQTFNSQNAISELVWPGHGSCFMAEYMNYNEGGYPTKVKGFLQISPLDEGMEDYPINGTIATTYKFDYIKKK